MGTRKQKRDRPLALGYVRVSTAEQADTGASLDAQGTALHAEAERRGWDLELVTDAGVSAKNMRRPGLTGALERLDAGGADHLMAVRIDRLSRSVHDFSGLVKRSAGRWGLVVLSPAIDLTDHTGRLTANLLASVAEFERELIGARTREGMRQRMAEGVVMGRPRVLPDDVVARILGAHRAGAGASEIARQLNADGVNTAHGGVRWWPSTVRKVMAGAV